MTAVIAKKFYSPLEAHQYYSNPEQQRNNPAPRRAKLHLQSRATQTDDVGAITDLVVSLMTALPEEQQFHMVTRILQVLAARSHPSAHVPDDFIKLCLISMERLKQLGKYDIVYGLVRGLGIMREDDSDSHLPALRMPMGMLEYIISFFQAESINKVHTLNYIIIANCKVAMLVYKHIIHHHYMSYY